MRRGIGRATREGVLAGAALCLFISAAASAEFVTGSCTASAGKGQQSCGSQTGHGIAFIDARRQAAEFIAYDHAIVLTPEQKKIMDEALSSIPAPCCAQYSIATCCCPCNLAKATWGLSKFLIAKQHYDVTEVNAAATEWLRFINPVTSTGNACVTGGCERPFSQNGCGGMDDQHVR